MYVYCCDCLKLCAWSRTLESGYHKGWVILSQCCLAPVSLTRGGPQLSEEDYQAEHAAEAADAAWLDLDERNRYSEER